jgi:hypothetical protein
VADSSKPLHKQGLFLCVLYVGFEELGSCKGVCSGFQFASSFQQNCLALQKSRESQGVVLTVLVDAVP